MEMVHRTVPLESGGKALPHRTWMAKADSNFALNPVGLGINRNGVVVAGTVSAVASLVK